MFLKHLKVVRLSCENGSREIHSKHGALVLMVHCISINHLHNTNTLGHFSGAIHHSQVDILRKGRKMRIMKTGQIITSAGPPFP